MTATPSYSSPKRKRSELDLGLDYRKTLHDAYSPALTPPADDATKFTQYPFPDRGANDGSGSGSPRSVVARQLGELDIHGDFVRRLDFGGVANKRARLRDGLKEGNGEMPPSAGGLADENGFGEATEEAVNKEEESDDVMEANDSTHPHAAPNHSSPASIIKSGSESSPDASEPTTPTTTPTKTKTKSPSKPSARKNSPPLVNEEEDPLTWHDDEITGHLAADKDDDGYGINGIGFRPTAAVAHYRSMKRKQQVREWLRREQGEERKRRGERRRGARPNGAGGGDEPEDRVEGLGERRGSKGKGVRFVVKQVEGGPA
jgi:hypothetical protein